MSEATKRVPPRFTPETPPGTEVRNRSAIDLQTDVDLVTHVINDNKTRTPKVLGQVKPSATTLTTLYTVPAATAVEVSTIFATNQSATPTAIRISIAVAGLADTPKQYIFYDVPIGANEAIQLNLSGIMLQATDVIRVYNTLATVSFGVFGTEIV